MCRCPPAPWHHERCRAPLLQNRSCGGRSQAYEASERVPQGSERAVAERPERQAGGWDDETDTEFGEAEAALQNRGRRSDSVSRCVCIILPHGSERAAAEPGRLPDLGPAAPLLILRSEKGMASVRTHGSCRLLLGDGAAPNQAGRSCSCSGGMEESKWKKPGAAPSILCLKLADPRISILDRRTPTLHHRPRALAGAAIQPLPFAASAAAAQQWR